MYTYQFYNFANTRKLAVVMYALMILKAKFKVNQKHNFV